MPQATQEIFPYLIVSNAEEAIEFYNKAFGAVQALRLDIPGTNRIMHAEIQIGHSKVMLCNAVDGPGCTAKSPQQLGGTPVTIHLYVQDIDKTFAQAVAAGAETLMPPTDMFWGDRFGKLRDPFGHEWSLATHVRDMSPEEMQNAAEECFKQTVG